ncbi:hypothetical protein NVV95_16445 [Herbiconiux sp. CPCC 205716]|uniref:Integral membrane protein n=1 Tax=Herbiconiux gentiana TaxID=2970912 RepID=A0ABT2GIV6_9MICO|nr:hypothetical protein [Herbiconiux gentiana]MCS5716137.1 hypothetical protein [Herbiconiux gentiana]
MAARPRRANLTLPLLAVAAIVAGVVTVVVSTPQSASFGWFAYAPLSGTMFSPAGAVVIGWGSVLGAIVVAGGIAGLAFWAGWMLGRMRSKNAPDTTKAPPAERADGA